MRKLFMATVIGLVAGVVSFVLFVPLFAVFLLIVSAIRHNHPDIALTTKVALLLAAVTAVLGFKVTLIRSVTIDKDK